MFKSIFSDIKLAWYRNVLYKIIIVNVVVFLIVNLLKFIFTITGGVVQVSPKYYTILNGLAISNDIVTDILMPWRWITYMFIHESLFHLFFNALYLFFFGRILGDLGGDKRLFPIYLICGLAGAIAFIAFSHFFPTWSMGSGFMIGASASAMGILWAAAFLSPDYELQLILLGRVKLKWIAVALTLVDMVSLTSFVNTGGHIAHHLGGAFMGAWLMWRLRSGVDWTLPVQNMLNRLSNLMDPKRRSKPKRSPLTIVHKQGPAKKKISKKSVESLSQQEKIDLILEKISRSGFDSLTKEEQTFLEKMSDK